MTYTSDENSNPVPDEDTGQDQDVDDGEQSEQKSESKLSDEEIITQGKACLKIAEDAEIDIRAEALDDITFSAGQQWPQKIKQDRELDGRPCLVINRMPQFVQQVTNDQRQNRPSIKVHPVDGGAKIETAKIIQGLIRHVEYISNADVAYDTAFDFAARGGFGYFRVVTDFVSPESFDQEAYIKRIRNNFSVHLDPSAQEPDGSDTNWGFVFDYVSKDEFKYKYPDSKLASNVDAWQVLGDSAPNWMRNDTVRVAEYFYKEYKTETIHLLSNGESVKDADLEKRLAAAAAANIPVKKVRSRKVQVPVIKWVKMTGTEILERTDWPGKYIPIIPVYGNELYIDGKRILESVVRHAKDPQRMYNYWKSAQTEAIALAPRTPFLVAEGQIEDYKEQWDSANRRNHAYLPYKPTTVAGEAAPPPARMTFEPAVQAITQAAAQAAEDIKGTTGIYDASLGAQSQETSGIAIQRRNQQSQTSNFHFMDNLGRSIKHLGRILVDLFPHIYDTPRAKRIVSDDGTHQVVTVNQTYKDENGKEVIYDLSAGTYDVTIDVGPSYASKRQEAAASMQSLAQSYPKVMEIAGDLYVKNMDWPGAQEIAERIKKTLPPGLADDPSKGPQPIPPQIQAQMQQMSQMIDGLTKQLHQASQEIETKQHELQSKERIETMRTQAEIEIALARVGSTEAVALLKEEVGALNSRLGNLGFFNPSSGQPPQGPQDPSQVQQQNSAPEAAGGMPADPAQGAQPPTGGNSPGQPMEQ